MNLLLAIVLAWTPAPPIRHVTDLPPVLIDIESHLPAGHPYRDADRVTWTHEGTHGINSLLRQKHGQPAFYVLRNRAVLLREQPTTMAAIADAIPTPLRGDVYRLYLIEMQRYWNEQPTYILDEWVSYTNGAEARQALGIRDRTETVRYALEFSVYSAYVVGRGDPQIKAFYKWQSERVMNLYQRSGVRSAYLDVLRQSPEAGQLRDWLRRTYGRKWTKSIYRF
jgi:disulfide oxidoreductase YuzD